MNNPVNPNFILQQIMKNPNIANNQLAQNAIRMYQQGDTKGLNEMMNNLCSEKGVSKENVIKQINSMYGTRY